MTTEAKRDLETNSSTSVTLLTKVLRADGAFALFSGMILVIGANSLAELIELSLAIVLVVVGFVLLGYAGMLFFVAGRGIEQEGAKLAIILNILWVILSYTGLIFGWFSVNLAGKWAIALIAEAALIFAIIEFIALRRAAKEVVG